jgi:phosphoglycolate phosphatase
MTAERRLIVFDIDGTLVDSQHLILAAMEVAFAALPHPMPEREAVLGIVGLSLPQAMAALAPHLPPEDTLRLAAHYRESFVLSRQAGGAAAHAPLYPGALGALERLATAPGTLLGVATGKARAGLDHVLAAHGLAGFFATAQTADDHPSKPHPSMLFAALHETGCAPAEGVMVGDTEFDVAMGRAAGMATIGVTWGYHRRERLQAAGADRVIDDFAALEDALAGLGAGAA